MEKKPGICKILKCLRCISYQVTEMINCVSRKSTAAYPIKYVLSVVGFKFDLVVWDPCDLFWVFTYLFTSITAVVLMAMDTSDLCVKTHHHRARIAHTISWIYCMLKWFQMWWLAQVCAMVRLSPVHKDVLLKSSRYPYMQSDSDYETTYVVTMNKVSFIKIFSKLS